MNANHKFLLGVLVSVLGSFLFSAETIFIPKEAPLFQYDKGWKVKATAQQDFIAEVIRKERVLMQHQASMLSYVDVYHLKIQGTEGLCYIPETYFKIGANGKPVQYFEKIDSMMFLGIFLILSGILAVVGYFHLKSEHKKYLLPLSLFLLFTGYAAWYIGMMSNSFIIPVDDLLYFDISKKLLELNFTSAQYRYTIGFPVLCIPFTLLFHLQDGMEFINIYMNFQTFILIPSIFLLLYWFFQKKMGCSRLQSYCILLLWFLLIVFYCPLRDSKTAFNLLDGYIPENFFCSANFFFPDVNIYLKYIQATWLGRNAMSDYMTMFLLIVLLFFAIKPSQSLRRFFILSMGFGFLCLVRINYILFAPLLAFVFYDSFSELWKDKKNYLYAGLCGTAGFMTVFIWQFILNKIQLGSPFIWPHSLHALETARGFVWKIIPYGFKFLLQCNYVYFLLGLSSLFFIPDRKTRVILTLWIFPTLLFFIGFVGIFNNSTRFIFALYPPLLAAFVMNPVWKASWNIRIKTAAVLIFACLLCKANLFFPDIHPWNVKNIGISDTAYMFIQGAVCLLCCAMIFTMRKELKADRAGTLPHLRFLILFTVFFFAGSVCTYIVGILFVTAFLYGVRDTFMEVKKINQNE